MDQPTAYSAAPRGPGQLREGVRGDAREGAEGAVAHHPRLGVGGALHVEGQVAAQAVAVQQGVPGRPEVHHEVHRGGGRATRASRV